MPTELEKLTLTVDEAAQLLGIGRGLASSMIREGRLPHLRFGKRIVVPRKALERFLEETRPRQEEVYE